MPAETADVHDKLMALLKRRGYLQPAYELYGGVAGFYDYGPLGAALKQNLQNLWREFYVLREGMAEIECPTVSPEPVFKASGHLDKFADTLVECPGCGTGSRADHLIKSEYARILTDLEGALKRAKGLHEDQPGELLAAIGRAYEDARASAEANPSPENIATLLGLDGKLAPLVREVHDVVLTYSTAGATLAQAGKTLYEGHVRCPACAEPVTTQTTKVYPFNLMFRTTIGPGSGRTGYLRPETAQGMFMTFPWLYRYFREQLPFGATQLGKAYRNEISPRQSLLRLREFNQMEAEVFFDPHDKTWPRFKELQNLTLNLLAAGESEIAPMKMGEAVGKRIIANGALGYFIALTHKFLVAAGIREENLRFRQHEPTEKAHYSTDTWDAEFLSPRFGWVEIVGIADRTDYDLKAHERVSGVELKALRRYPEPREVEVNRVVPNPARLGPLFKGRAKAVAEALQKLDPARVTPGEPVQVRMDDENVEVPADGYRVEQGTERVEGEHFTPHVVEPSYGVDRIFYAILEGAYAEKEWATLQLPARMAPVKAGVFPLMAKDGLDALARELEGDLVLAGVPCQYDEGGSIGKRYARQDEIGTPYCVTVDYDTRKDGTVTLRERDSAAQVRLSKAEVAGKIRDLVAGRIQWKDLS